MPGALPQSTRMLMDSLKHHELVLLEGPPGTGKTHTIMNLLIHCINTKQRVLIVSDQQAAIEALVEKLQDYLVGSDMGTPAERKWNELLFSAIKVVDEVETGEQTLPDLVNKLTKTLKVHDLPPGMGAKGENLEKKLKSLTDKIEKLTEQITKKMIGHMGDDVPFDRRVPKKDESQAELQSLIEFLSIVKGKSVQQKEIVDAFVINRLNLIRDNMGECYNFFKIPGKNLDAEVKILKEDEKILSLILQHKPGTLEAFQELIQEYPRHEIIRYLESVMQLQVSMAGNGFTRLIRKIRTSFRPPLQISTRKLLKIVQDQIALLKKSDNWSDGLWQLLKDMHECIRVAEAPCRALTLYSSVNGQAGFDAGNDPGKGTSIQGELEQIEELYKQQDRVVRERLVENLREISQSATASKRGSGTN
ncbi:MAG: AAA domain-containing protein, partial [Gammaproteobacteria bacterium]|nr:AAA domain-containing protein [Gammaproteobacteria bacterium]